VCKIFYVADRFYDVVIVVRPSFIFEIKI